MTTTSKIEWTEQTWNPVVGCTKISAGCKFCYAETMAKRLQGVDFFVRENGSNPLEVSSEVDRYCSWVGQACGYKVGHSEIVRQRGRAQAALGAKYDLRDFDNVVVEGGNVPLDVLGENISRYIAGARG